MLLTNSVLSILHAFLYANKTVDIYIYITKNYETLGICVINDAQISCLQRFWKTLIPISHKFPHISTGTK